MEQTQTHLYVTKLQQRVNSTCLDRSDLEQLCRILKDRSDSAADIEVSNLQQLQQTDAEFENDKRLLREAFELLIVVEGTNGEQIAGTVDGVFSSPNFPSEIRRLYTNSASSLQSQYNYFPRNSYELTIDFSKSPLFDLSFVPSASTPNNSTLVVQGQDSTWANGVFHEITSYLRQRATRRQLLHSHSIYDVLIWIIAIPAAFWLSFRLSGIIEAKLSLVSRFLSAAAYLYMLLLVLIVFRFLFGYARWLWPSVEYRTANSTVANQRLALATIILGLMGAMLYDIVKAAFL